MMQSEFFTFDGVKSSDMGVYLIRIDSGMIPSPFFGGQDIEEERVQNKIVPYHYGVNREPIEFTIQISPLEKEWTPQLRNKIGRWLIRDTYKPFQTADDMGKVYYVICTEAPNFELAHNRGYLELTFRSNSPYAWTANPVIQYENLLNNTTTKIIEVENMSNVLKYFYPKMEISLLNLNGSATNTKQVKIKNLSDGGREFILGVNSDLVGNEVISIDNENEIILTGNPIHNVFPKFNRKWLRLTYGVNRLEITGKMQIQFKNEFPILQ